jgi:hypothetical protein
LIFAGASINTADIVVLVIAFGLMIALAGCLPPKRDEQCERSLQFEFGEVDGYQHRSHYCLHFRLNHTGSSQCWSQLNPARPLMGILVG